MQTGDNIVETDSVLAHEDPRLVILRDVNLLRDQKTLTLQLKINVVLSQA